MSEENRKEGRDVVFIITKTDLLRVFHFCGQILENWRQKEGRGTHDGKPSAWKGTTVHKMNNLSRRMSPIKGWLFLFKFLAKTIKGFLQW